MKKIKLGYCVIVNPFSEEGETMVFVSKQDSPSLNTEIFEQPAYNEACLLLKRLGFVQTEILTFENMRGNKIEIDLVKRELEAYGMTYNKNLEASIRKEMKTTAQEAEKQIIRDEMLQDPLTDLSKYLESKSFQETSKLGKFPIHVNSHRVPEYGETIELYFYLFLETTLLKDGEILFMLNGDFYSKKSDSQRKFIKIIGCKFRRIDTGNPDELHLESVSKYKDFLADIDCLYTASLEFQPKGLIGYENSPLKKNYSIMEIRNVLNLDNYIVVNISNATNYGKLMGWSHKIKEELVSIRANTVPVSYLLAKTESIQNRLEKRMNGAVEKEEYEVAQAYKDSIEELNTRIGWLKEVDKDEVNLAEYNKHMNLGETNKEEK